MDKTPEPTRRYILGTHFKSKDTRRLNLKGWMGKIVHANSNQKRSGPIQRKKHNCALKDIDWKNELKTTVYVFAVYKRLTLDQKTKVD